MIGIPKIIGSPIPKNAGMKFSFPIALNRFDFDNKARIIKLPHKPEPVKPARFHMKSGVKINMLFSDPPACRMAEFASTFWNATPIQIGAMTEYPWIPNHHNNWTKNRINRIPGKVFTEAVSGENRTSISLTIGFPVTDSIPFFRTAMIKIENKIGHKFSNERLMGVGTPGPKSIVECSLLTKICMISTASSEKTKAVKIPVPPK